MFGFSFIKKKINGEIFLANNIQEKAGQTKWGNVYRQDLSDRSKQMYHNKSTQRIIDKRMKTVLNIFKQDNSNLL